MPRELVKPSLLLLLGQAGGHGWSLAERLREVGFDIGDVGVVYAALRRLEHAGLVRSSIDYPVSGPARRVYSLTSAGRRACDEWAATLARLDACFGPRTPV